MVDIFNKLIKAGLTPNTFYVLYCIKNKTKPADFVSLELEKHRLVENEWITKDFKLSDKSVIFIQEIDSYFRKKKKETSQDLMGDSFISKIKSYNELFPKLKLQSGKYARVNAKTLEANFRWFFKEYDYDWDTILKATQRYVSEYSLNNYAYMRTAQYFIRKQNIDKSFDSDLATYCEIVMSDLDDFNYFKENVI